MYSDKQCGKTAKTGKFPIADLNAFNRVFKQIGTLCLAFSIAGCSVSKGMGNLTSEPELITGSVTKSVEDEGIDPTDAEAIKLTVVEGGSAGSDSALLAWSNPETGNSGTITAIDKFIGNHGQSCKKFRTSVDSFMGISLYNGETCELKPGFWVLSWFIREEAA
jgi:surface antigen